MINENEYQKYNTDIDLTEYARALYGRDSDYVAPLIAPDISEPEAVLGKFIPWSPATLTPDQLGELMEPNQIDVNQDFEELQFSVSDHELQAKVSRRLRSRLRSKGFSNAQIDNHVTRILTQKLKFMRDYVTINHVTNTALYGTGLVNTTAANWGTAGTGGGPAYNAIMTAIDALEVAGANTDTIHILASAAVWSAIRRDVMPLFSGVSAMVTKQQIADALGVRPIVSNLNVAGSSLIGSNVVIYASRADGDFTSSAWHTVDAGISGAPEPTVYRFNKEGSEHRWDGIGAYHDYSIVDSGADANGKQQLAFIYTAITPAFPS